MLCLPVEFKGSYLTEFRECSPNDAKVEEVSQVCPDASEQDEVGSSDTGIKIIQCLGCLHFSLAQAVLSIWDTYREEEITDVVRDVDAYAHIREVESVAETDESQRDDVM